MYTVRKSRSTHKKEINLYFVKLSPLLAFYIQICTPHLFFFYRSRSAPLSYLVPGRSCSGVWTGLVVDSSWFCADHDWRANPPAPSAEGKKDRLQ